MQADPSPFKSLENVKLDFLLSVYESVSKQIQAMDLKISILLSWNGVIAVMVSREIPLIIKQKSGYVTPMLMVALSVIGLAISAFYTWRVLKPRIGKMENNFAGLLFSGDILRLGKNPTERMGGYMEELAKIKTHEEIYRQFTKSIVLISDIHINKNRLFNRGLSATALSFLILALLIALRGLHVDTI